MRLTPAISQGSESSTSDKRSLIHGRSKKPASSGPRMQPRTFTAYAFPALAGSPPAQRSTSMGVRYPSSAVKGAMPTTSRTEA